MARHCVDALSAGAENLLVQCGGARPGDRVLICHEPSSEDFYDTDVVTGVAAAARDLGLSVELSEVPFQPDATVLPDAVQEQMRTADLTVFLARIGDQLRFREFPDGSRAVISYALSAEALASPFGTVPHAAFEDLKRVIDAAVTGAHSIHVTCPAGTDFSGRVESVDQSGTDVSLQRFPMLVTQPVLAHSFSGRVALPGFLTGTGSMYYHPFTCRFDGQVFALFAEGRLTGFEGSTADVAAAEAHYDFVAGKFGIDRTVVHSWHVGMHPGCSHPEPASTNFERWSGSAFGNPRLLHFHTCGGYAPGEISWNVVDPTVVLDGVAVWEDGRLHPERLPGGADVLAAHPDAAAAFGAPAREIGL